jgi:hypothetical protein
MFYLCQRSVTDPDFPKYPRIPVRACRGYEKCEPEPTTDEASKKPPL